MAAHQLGWYLQEAQLLAVESSGHNGQPNHVDRQEPDECGHVEFQVVHDYLPSWFSVRWISFLGNQGMKTLVVRWYWR